MRTGVVRMDFHYYLRDLVSCYDLPNNRYVAESAGLSRMDFDLVARKKSLTWTDALRQFNRQAEKVGVLVLVSGVVTGGPAALARMRLVNDDRKRADVVPAPDLVEDERELLDRRDDDLLALLDEPPEIARPNGLPHS